MGDDDDEKEAALAQSKRLSGGSVFIGEHKGSSCFKLKNQLLIHRGRFSLSIKNVSLGVSLTPQMSISRSVDLSLYLSISIVLSQTLSLTHPFHNLSLSVTISPLSLSHSISRDLISLLPLIHSRASVCYMPLGQRFMHSGCMWFVTGFFLVHKVVYLYYLLSPMC